MQELQQQEGSTDELQKEIAGLIVSSLNLDVSPEQIQPDDPLFGEGLGLDSIDILEVALVLSKRYGIQLKSDSDAHIVFTVGL